MERHRIFERFYVVIRPPCPGEGVDGRGKGGAGVYQGYPTFTWDMQIKSNLGSAGRKMHRSIFAHATPLL